MARNTGVIGVQLAKYGAFRIPGRLVRNLGNRAAATSRRFASNSVLTERIRRASGILVLGVRLESLSAGRKQLTAPGGKRKYYRDRLLTDYGLTRTSRELLQAYFDRWQIEVNHKEEKDTLGIGQAQVRSRLSVPRQPAFAVAVYSALHLAALLTFGPHRDAHYQALPKWCRNAALMPRPDYPRAQRNGRKSILSHFPRLQNRLISTRPCRCTLIEMSKAGSSFCKNASTDTRL